MLEKKAEQLYQDAKSRHSAKAYVSSLEDIYIHTFETL